MDGLRVWGSSHKDWKALPCFVFWEVWRARNSIIFEDVLPDVSFLGGRALAALRDFNGVISSGLGS